MKPRSDFKSTRLFIKNGIIGTSPCTRRPWLLIMSLLLFMTACSSPPEQGVPAERTIRVIEVEDETPTLQRVFIGEVVPAKEILVSFLVSGQLQQLLVDSESPVQTGTLLGVIDPKDYQLALEAAQAQLRGAEANLNRALAGVPEEEIRQAEIQVRKAAEVNRYAQQQLQRMESLLEAGGISQVEFEAVRLEAVTASLSFHQAEEQLARLTRGALQEEIVFLASVRDAATVQLHQAEIQLNRTSLRSESEGTVTRTFYEEGELYREGTPLLALKSDASMVRISVNREELNSLATGDSVQIRLEGSDVTGKVALISRTPDVLTQTYPVEISLPKGSYTAGETARVMIEGKIDSGVLIPMSAVLAGKPDVVYVIREGKAHQVPVQVRGVEGEKLLVEGLMAGDQLVVEGMRLLRHGETVQILQEGENP